MINIIAENELSGTQRFVIILTIIVLFAAIVVYSLYKEHNG